MIDSLEFAELMAYEQAIEPIGERRADYRAAMIAHAQLAANGGKAKLEDFLPDFTPVDDSPEARSRRLRDAMARLRAMRQTRG